MQIKKGELEGGIGDKCKRHGYEGKAQVRFLWTGSKCESKSVFIFSFVS